MTNFPNLPLELRLHIWKLTVETRTVEVRFEVGRVPFGKKRRTTRRGVLYATSATPVPVALHTCREARSLLATKHLERAFCYGAEPRYIWLNFELDIISIGQSEFCWTEPVASRIRRLQFERECDEYFFHGDNGLMMDLFPNVEEIYVRCLDCPEGWYYADDAICWPCRKESIWLINLETDEMVTAAEIHTRLEGKWEEWPLDL
jgi:hypothetical protein